MTLEKALELVAQDRHLEALGYLSELKRDPSRTKGVELLWGRLAALTSFRYLGVLAVRSEISAYDDPEAKEFHTQLLESSQKNRAACRQDYPLISLLGILSEDTVLSWEKCIDSLGFQGNTRVEIILGTTNLRLQQIFSSQGINTYLFDESKLLLEELIKLSKGDVISVIENPNCVFSDLGLMYVAAVFKSRADVSVLQTERLTYSAEGINMPLRNNVPRWSPAVLLDPIGVEEPSCLFSWRGFFLGGR